MTFMEWNVTQIMNTIDMAKKNKKNFGSKHVKRCIYWEGLMNT